MQPLKSINLLAMLFVEHKKQLVRRLLKSNMRMDYAIQSADLIINKQ